MPRPADVAAYITCGFCGSSAALDAGVGPPISDRAQASAVAIQDRYGAHFDAFEAALGGSAKRPREAFLAAANATLGTICDGGTLTEVVFGLVAEFQRSSGVDLSREPRALSRVAVSYLGALDGLRTLGPQELKIPFISATPQGPVEFRLVVTIEGLRKLARPSTVAKKPVFFKKLFGR